MKFSNDEKIHYLFLKHERIIKFIVTLLLAIVVIGCAWDIIQIIQKNVYNLNTLANLGFDVLWLVEMLYLYHKAYPIKNK